MYTESALTLWHRAEENRVQSNKRDGFVPEEELEQEEEEHEEEELPRSRPAFHPPATSCSRSCISMKRLLARLGMQSVF